LAPVDAGDAVKNCKAAGTRVEHKVRDTLEEDGWVVVRAPASLGAADLIGLKRGVVISGIFASIHR